MGKRFKIAIASGKGGTGKTFVSANVYQALSSGNGTKATLIDCDAEAPNAVAFFDVAKIAETPVYSLVPVIDTDACTFCGLCYEYCHYGAIFYLPDAGIIKVLDELCHSCGACSYACRYHAITLKKVETGKVSQFETPGGGQIIEGSMSIGAMTPVPVIKAAIHTTDMPGITGQPATGNPEVVIFDAPPGTSCPFVHTVETADYIIIVTEPTPFGLSDLKQSVETLRLMDKRFGVVVNKAGIGDTSVYQYLAGEAIPLLLEIPFDREFAALSSGGEVVVRSNPGLKRAIILMIEEIISQYGNSHCQR